MQTRKNGSEEKCEAAETEGVSGAQHTVHWWGAKPESRARFVCRAGELSSAETFRNHSEMSWHQGEKSDLRTYEEAVSAGDTDWVQDEPLTAECGWGQEHSCLMGCLSRYFRGQGDKKDFQIAMLRKVRRDITNEC